MTTTAIADANSFYCSVEQVFRPDLAGKPILVVGNNDSCVVSRSAAAKSLIPMGVSIFEDAHRRAIRDHHIAVFSSNYSLYNDFSNRIHAVMDRYSPRTEKFSIDESFLDLSAISPGERIAVMREMRRAILQETGVPVSIGLAATKVRSKLAADYAKRMPDGVRAFDNEQELERILAMTPCSAIWYIGEARARQLRAHFDIYNGLQLMRADLVQIRRVLHVPVARIVCELRGIPALPLRTTAPPRKEIMCARAFGRLVTDLHELQQAVASYTAAAGRRLNAHRQVCSTLSISLMTNSFRQDLPQYHASCLVPLMRATNHVPEMIAAARQAVEQMYHPGISYYRAGVLLSDLASEEVVQGNLFAGDPDVKQQQLMAVIRAIEARFGRGAIYIAATGGPSPRWGMRQEMMSPRYVTRWSDLPVARA